MKTSDEIRRAGRRNRAAATLAGIALAVHGVGAAVVIRFDYSYDSSGFFDQGRRDVLEMAATAVTSRLEDSLAPIPFSSGSQTWTPAFYHPTSGSVVQLPGLSVAQDSVVVYVGARALDPGTLAEASFGTGISSLPGDAGTAWRETVLARGQTGVDVDGSLPNTSTDFGPWGGSISFTTGYGWYFDDDVTTLDIPANQYDFYSVAMHELGHILGLGTADSWSRLIDGGLFTGSVATGVNGSAPAVHSDDSHWAPNTLSVTPGISATSQLAAMTPDIAIGTRKLFTELDWAAMEDIGWQVTAVPEPADLAQVAAVALGLAAIGRRMRRRAFVR